MKNYYRKLTRDDLLSLKDGDPVHMAFGKADPIPAMLVGRHLNRNVLTHLTLAYLSAGGCAQVRLDVASLNRHYRLYEKLLSVATPDGDIVAYDKHDKDYPGVCVALRHPWSFDPEKPHYGQEILLSMTECVPSGEIVVLDRSQDETVRSAQFERSRAFHKGMRRMEQGLVTRAFIDDGHGDEHVMVPHLNYEMHARLVLDRKSHGILLSAIENPDGSGLDLENDVPMQVIAEFGDGHAAVLSVILDGEKGLVPTVRLIDETGHALDEKPVNPHQPLWPVHFTRSGVWYKVDVEADPDA